ncbi:hypothetical protein T492DRAFT_901734 [Pavlovales sp. CCMP2436]|nr:hypothetical protein T492DRAFT_901734 [Pavlovales sp. CCMP2436]
MFCWSERCVAHCLLRALAASTLQPVGKHMAMLKEASQINPVYKFLDPGPLGKAYELITAPLTPSPELRVAPRAAGSGGPADSAAASLPHAWSGEPEPPTSRAMPDRSRGKSAPNGLATHACVASGNSGLGAARARASYVCEPLQWSHNPQLPLTLGRDLNIGSATSPGRASEALWSASVAAGRDLPPHASRHQAAGYD